MAIGGTGVSSTEYYRNSEWHIGPSLPFNISHACGTKLNGSHFMLMGGLSGPLANAFVLDWSDFNNPYWKEVSPMPLAIYGLSCTILPNGNVMVVGGRDKDGKPSLSSIIYDPKTDEWFEGTSFIEESYYGNLVVVNDKWPLKANAKCNFVI